MNKRSHWLDETANHRTLWIGFWLVLAATVAAQWWWPIYGHFSVEAWFGFNALYGFGVCALMIGAAKLIALWLKRPDTYYDTSSDTCSDTVNNTSPDTSGSHSHD